MNKCSKFSLLCTKKKNQNLFQALSFCYPFIKLCGIKIGLRTMVAGGQNFKSDIHNKNNELLAESQFTVPIK